MAKVELDIVHRKLELSIVILKVCTTWMPCADDGGTCFRGYRETEEHSRTRKYNGGWRDQGWRRLFVDDDMAEIWGQAIL